MASLNVITVLTTSDDLATCAETLTEDTLMSKSHNFKNIILQRYIVLFREGHIFPIIVYKRHTLCKNIK